MALSIRLRRDQWDIKLRKLFWFAVFFGRPVETVDAGMPLMGTIKWSIWAPEPGIRGVQGSTPWFSWHLWTGDQGDDFIGV